MRARRLVAALLVLLVLGVFATPTLAASVTYPSSVTYGDSPTLKVSGLKATTDYLLIIYDRFELPVASIPFTSGADGTFSFPGFGPEQTDAPGMYTFAIVTADFHTVATASATLTGVSPWFFTKRLGS